MPRTIQIADGVPESRSAVFHADNLEVLPQLADGAFTVVYLDPPFNTGRAQVRTSTTSVRSVRRTTRRTRS